MGAVQCRQVWAGVLTAVLWPACASPSAHEADGAPPVMRGSLAPAAGTAGTAAGPAADDPTLAAPAAAGAVEVPARSGRGSLGRTPLPCAVARVLTSSCQGCHSASPHALAPMALVTREDLLAPAISDPSRAVYQLVARRIHAQHDAMPPPASRRLTSGELDTLDAFVSAGAPPGAGDCADSAPAVMPATREAASTAAEIDTCYRLQVHDQEVADDTTPYRVPSGEFYSCFYFDVPWPAGSQALSVRATDAPLAHHWMLYHVVDEPYSAGQIIRQADNCGLQVRDVLGVHTAHSEREQPLPEGVGLQLPAPESGHGLLLEVHYFNSGAPATDTSGAEVCTAKTPQAHVAGLGMLGANVFVLPPRQPLDLPTTCTPQFAGDIHLLRSLPHMHARGVALDTLIQHAGASSEVLLDVPFDFNDQRMYDTPAVVHAGDSLLTTCHYVNDSDNVIVSGFGRDDEMCINFVYAWPAGALSCP